METFKLPVDTIYGRREVEFNGRRVDNFPGRKTDDNNQGVTKTEYTEYEVENQRRIIHTARWIDQPSNVQFCTMSEGVEPDFLPPSHLPEPERGRSLELDEALALSRHLKK